MQEAYRNAMGANGEGPKIQMPSEDMLKHLPEDERLQQAAQAAKAAASAQGMVESLKSKAGMLTDPKQREKMLSEAYRNEVEAKGQSKKARILKSGTFQGGAGGAGIGMATGMGLGTVVGTLTGVVASVPTMALGGLVGAGTGVIHGPWIKLGGGKKGEGGTEEEEQMVQLPQEAIDNGAVQIDENSGQVTVNDQEALQAAASAAAMVSAEKETPTKEAGGRRKPKKLEIRSNKHESGRKAGSPANTEAKPRKKPPKLETRSRKAQ